MSLEEGATTGRLARIWAEVLERPDVAPGDDFFALGGTSVSVARLVARVAEELGVEIGFADLFEAPVLEALAARVDALRSPVAPAREVVSASPGRRDPERAWPLTHPQRRMWFLEQLHPDLPTYRMITGVRLRGSLDVDGLRRALGAVVARHAALRARFAESQGVPVQRFAAPGPVALPVEDLRAAPGEDWDDAVGRRAREEVRRPLDLRAGPPWRATLLRRDGAEHVLLLVVHHLVFDAASRVIVLRELAEAYREAAAGREPSTAPVEVDYPEFAAREQEGEAAGRRAADREHWLAYLGRDPPLLELPADHPRPAVPDFEGGRATVEIPPPLRERIGQVAAAAGTTEAAVLLAAFAALLHRHTAAEAMVVGLMVSGRERPEAAPLVGLFVNQLPLRLEVAPGDGLATLVPRAREALRAGLTRPDVPYEELVREVRAGRGGGDGSLFQVAFNYKPRRDGALDLGEALRVAEVPLDPGVAPFELTLVVDHTREALACHLDHARSLFEPERMRRMAGHLRRLLEEMVRDPRRPVGDLPMLSEEEIAELRAWNDTAADFPRHRLLHELVEEQVDRRPDAVAVEGEASRFTYGELDRRANQLAHRLRRLGVGPGGRVGVALDRTPDLVAALLAVHKAGASYVPLDPTLPADRLAFMVEQSGLSVVVTRSRVRSAVPTGGATVVDLDADAPALAGEPHDRPPRSGSPDGPAYVLYTSGSTGHPKGVEVPVRAVVNLVHAVGRELALTPADRVAAQITLAFDPSVLELWMPLVTGARIVLATREVAVDGSRMRERVERSGVTVLVGTPASYRLLLAAGWSGGARVRMVCGGEALTPELARELSARGTVWNAYGPTETTVLSTFHRVTSPPGPILIGRPIANTRVHVLDAGMRHVPAGVPGELHIGGEGLALGYHGRPDLTAERFVPDPFQSAPGARLYRTGDLVRWTPGGLEFLGRGDDQVKVRGFRIELGEIEAALARAPRVREAAVVVREDRPGERRLVGYVCGDALPDAAGLRAALGRVLPEYMVPTAVVALDRLPRTPGGKVDRRALPPPPAATGSGPAPAPPRTDVERALAELWGQVLETAAPGIEDDFFALGGHSLLAMRLAVLAQERLDVDLAVRDVFENPTVAALARRVEALREAGRASRRVARVGRDRPVPLSPHQRALWLEVQLRAGDDAYNTAAAFRVDGPIDRDRLRRALVALADRHEVLRARIVQEGGEPAMAFDRPASSAELLEREAATAEELAWGVAEEVRRPIDLAAGPLWRCVAWRGPGDGSALALVAHHLILDNASLGILLRDLARLHADPGARLGARAHDFADLAVEQRARLEAGREELSGFWKEHLRGADLTPELPRPCVPCPAGEEGRACVTRRALPAGLATGVRDLAARWGTTPFHLYVAAWMAVLRTWTGQDDLVVGSLVSLRDTPAAAEVVGYLVSPLAVRARLDGAISFREAVARVARRWSEVRDHALLPMDLVVQAAAGPRTSVGSPFQVFFALVEDAVGAVRLDGRPLEPLDARSGHAMFRLSLSVMERGDDVALLLEADRATLDPGMAARLVEHVALLLERSVADPDRPLRELPSSTPGDRERVERWNATEMPFPREATLPALLEAQVDRTPGTPAVVGDESSLTFDELDRRANQLARHLRSLGVGPGSVVGLVAWRAPRSVVAIFAILKAGAAWVPLDPEHPRERVALVLEEAGVRVVVSARPPAWELPDVAHVRLDDPGQARRIDAESDARLGTLAGPEAPAYVIYTSGSTGRPKGVVVSHRAAVNTWCGYRRALARHLPARALRTSLDAALSFDASVAQVLGLLGGDTLHVAPEEVRLDAAAMVAYARRHRLDVLDWIPTQMRALLDAGLLEGSWRPALLVVGGEPVDEATWRRLAAADGVEAFNFYGPTECTVNAAAARITGSAVPPHVGAPLGNVQAHVLDPDLRPVPEGVAGELCIGGEGVALGYLNRPDLTAERFLPDPFTGRPGARIYRTGDRARWVDGRLEFLGRVDGQVKIRGLRIELGEIDAALERHPEVREAATVARGAGEVAQLVSWVVGRDGARPPDAAELRRFLKETLPGYMIPAALLEAAELPRLQSGKVDRRALAAREVDLPRVVPARERAAWTPTSKRLYEIWGEILGRRDVGLADDFFDVGGNSLLAVRLMADVDEVFGVRLPPAVLVRAPTLAQLAAIIEERRPEPPPRMVALREDGDALPLFLVTPFNGDALMFRELSRALGAPRPVYSLQPPPIVGTRCQETVEGAAEEMAGLITRAQPAGPYQLAGYCIGGQIAFEVATRLAASGRKVAFLGLIDSVPTWTREARAARQRIEFAAPSPHDAPAARGAAGAAPPGAPAVGASGGVARKLTAWREKGRRHVLRATFELCRRTGLRQPPFLRDEDLLDAFIASLYRPRPYGGEAVFFRSLPTQQLPLPPGGGWSGLVARLREIDVPGGHVTMLHPPDVSVLGALLGGALDDAGRDGR